MGGVISLLFIILLAAATVFIFNIYDIIKHGSTKSYLIGLSVSFIVLACTIPLFILSINKFISDQDGEEVARYNQSEYDLDRIFMEYYIRQSLHEGGFYYKFEVEFDATDDEYIEVRKGSGDYNDNIIIIYHKYSQENSFLDPFDLEDYKR